MDSWNHTVRSNRIKLLADSRNTWVFAVGKDTPSSLRDLMVALMRLSCGSFWKSSAHSAIRALSFSATFGWTWGEENEDGRHYQQTSKFIILWNKDLPFCMLLHFNFCSELKFLTLLNTPRTSLANSREQISRWKIFPLFETQAPSN